MSTLTLDAIAGPAGPLAEAAPAQEPDTGLICLTMLARYHGLSADPEQIAHRFAEAGQAMRLPDLLHAARQLGLHARVHRPSPQRLAHLPLPAMAPGADGRFFVLARIEGEGPAMRALVHEPLKGAPHWVSAAELLALWSGELVLFTSRASLVGQLAKFDFSWFVPAIVKYRRLLLEVLAVSLVLQLFALVTPLFFQVVMDKVLVHQSLSTLDVIAIGLLVVSVFEVVLGFSQYQAARHYIQNGRFEGRTTDASLVLQIAGNTDTTLNDELRGGTGSDTYRFARGDGQDVIKESNSDETATDRLEFQVTGLGAVSYDQLWFSTHDGYSVTATVMGTSDSVRLDMVFVGAAMETITAADLGTSDPNDVRTLSAAGLSQLVDAMSTMAPPAGATSWSALTSQQQQQLQGLGVWA
jgi:hypothetical protein